MTVCRNGDIERLPGRGLESRQFPHKVHHAPSQKWLPASDPNLRDSQRDHYPRHPQIIRKWQLAVHCAFISSAAVDTLVITAIGNRNPQVGYGAAEFVGEEHLAVSLQQCGIPNSSISRVWLNAEC